MTPDASNASETGIVARADTFLVGLAAFAAVAITLYIMFAIAGALFRFEAPDELLIVAEAMVGLVFLPQAFLVRTKGHVEVDVLADRFPTWLQRRLEYLSILFGILFFTLLLIAAWVAFDRSVTLGTRHMGTIVVPEWIGRGLLLFGIAAGLAAQILLLVRRIQQRT